MASFLDSTVKDIDVRLRELKQEISRLEAARSALVGTRRGPGRPPGSRTTRRRTSGRSTTTSTTRARRGGRRSGTRAAQTLSLVRKQPGVTIPEIAKSMRIEPNYLYRVLPKLVKDGQVKRQGKGWHPA